MIETDKRRWLEITAVVASGLMKYVFMELLFVLAYFKWRNLWPMGIYHGWVASLLLFLVLGRDLWNELWKIF